VNRPLSTLLCALLLTGATTLHAQTPPADAGKGGRGHGMRDCSQAQDPKACEERRQKMKAQHEERRQKARAAHEEARKACDGKQGDERRQCMQTTMCAKAPDPAKCEARSKERGEHRKKRMEERKAAGDAVHGVVPR